MASSIDASTSGAGGVITTADNTGILQLKSGGTTIATISSTGLALNAGNITLPSTAAPAFSAYNNANQTLSTNTTTKIQFNTEVFDTNSNFDSTTNYRFTPTVAGYYHINAILNHNATVTNPTRVRTSIYKNGAQYKRMDTLGDGGAYVTNSLSCVVYMNGSSDYIELYGYQQGASGGVFSGESLGYGSLVTLSGALIRSA